MKIGKFDLTTGDHEVYWLCYQGEGLQIKAKELEELLGKYYDENF